MSIDQFIHLIDILAWPGTALLLFLTTPWLTRRLVPFIERIKYKDVEVEFSKKIAEVSENVSGPPLIESGESKERDRIYRLVEISPASAVIEAWTSLERVAEEKVRQLVPKGEIFKDPLGRPIDYLDFKGALVPSAASAVRDLRMLRNQAVHAGPADISREDALQYAAVANRIRMQIDAIIELPAVKLSALTLLIVELNHLIDSRKYDDITIDEVYQWIDEKSILSSLKIRTKGNSDLSSFSENGPYLKFSTFYHDQMKQLKGGYAGDHRKKWGVENLGLCLLLAWTTELIQQGAGWYPNEI
ncbi:MAG: DUF4145 domain-containing protein [Rhodospirillales bacterium]